MHPRGLAAEQPPATPSFRRFNPQRTPNAPGLAGLYSVDLGGNHAELEGAEALAAVVAPDEDGAVHAGSLRSLSLWHAGLGVEGAWAITYAVRERREHRPLQVLPAPLCQNAEDSSLHPGLAPPYHRHVHHAPKRAPSRASRDSFQHTGGKGG